MTKQLRPKASIGMSGYERRVEANAAFDKRHADSSKDYGTHGVEFRFSLVGEKAAVSFGLSTGWLLPRTLGLDDNVSSTSYRRALGERDVGGRLDPLPMGMHFHVAEPLAGITERSPCDLLPGGMCYGDVIYTGADRPFFALVEGGIEGLWESLATELAAFTGEELKSQKRPGNA